MKAIAALWCVCALLPSLVGNEKMRVTAYYQIFLPPPGQVSPYPVAVHHLDIWVNVRNDGTENTVVPTAGYITRQIADGKSLKLILLFEVPHSVTGEKVRRSDTSYELVTLKPGEMTEIKFSTGYLESPVTKVEVTYKVENDLAEMHRIWGGQMEAEATDAVAMYMPPNDNLNVTTDSKKARSNASNTRPEPPK